MSTPTKNQNPLMYCGYINYLTTNISLREAILWAQHLDMSNEDKLKAIEEAQKSLTPEIYNNIQMAAVIDQQLRDYLNLRFDYLDYGIAIKYTSWLRSKQWELYRKRKGNSKHTEGHGRDLTFYFKPKSASVNKLNYPDRMLQKVYEVAFDYIKQRKGGIGLYTRNDRTVFIHRDLGDNNIWFKSI